MPTYRLTVPTGSIPLAGKELTIGSSPDCQIRAEGPDVASHHAKVVVREGQPPLIEPFSPTCQVFIDGQAVAGQAELRPGQVLRVGTTELHLELSSEAGVPVGQKRPLWKRLLRWSLYGVGTLVGLLVLVIVLIPVILSEARVKQKLKDVLEAQFRRDVSIGAVELELLHGLKIRDLRIENKEGFSTDKPFLTIKEVDIRAEVWPFLKSRFRRLAASVTIREPAVYLERDAKTGQLNTAGMFEGEPDQKGGQKGKEAGPKPAAEKGKPSGGPLGPIQDLNFKLSLDQGSLLFDDRREKTSGRVDGLAVKADVVDFNVPELRGKFSYALSLAVPNAGHPGTVSVRGGADLDLKESPSPSFLGLDIENLTGEMVNVKIDDLDLAGLAKCFNFPAPGPTSVQLTLAPVTAKPLTLKVNGSVNVPRIDAVSLGLQDKPVSEGAEFTLAGQLNLESGSGSLTLAGKSGLWDKELGGTIQVDELPALMRVVGAAAKPNPAARVKMDFSASADIANLSGGKVNLLRAKAPIKGSFKLGIKADGPVTDLVSTVDLALKDVTVPAAYTDGKELPAEDVKLGISARVSLDPETLNLRKVAGAATVASAAVHGELTNGLFVPPAGPSPAQLGGEIAFKAKFKNILDRYKQVLTHLPVLDEDLTLTASASSAKGPIALRAELETRREGAQPDPIKVTLAANLEAGKEWNFRNVDLKAKTPQSSALDFSASGQVDNALSPAPALDIRFSSQKIDLAALRGRLDQLIKLGGEKLAKLDVRGQLSLSGGEVKSTKEGFSSNLTMDLTGLEVSGFGKDGKESLKDSKISLILNADVEPAKRSLKARTVSLSSSICSLNLSGEVRDWSALLGEYKFSLEADAEKAVALLRALDVFKANLSPKGKVVVAISADTRAGTVTVERFLIDLDLAEVRINGGFQGFLLEKLLSKDEKQSQAALEALSGELVVEKFRTNVDVLSQLRDTIPGIPKELSGTGPISVTAKAAGSKGKIALSANLDAGKAAVVFTGLINKPAETAAKVTLDGVVALDAKSQALKIAKLDVNLGELHVTGSGSSALDLSSVQVALDIPKFAPESVRAMFPPLADFAFGGKVELAGLNLSGNLKEVLDSKQDVFTGRLAGLTFGGKARLEDVSLETKALPYMKLRADGPVELDTGFVKLDGLSAGIVHKRTQQETRFTVTKGQVTSAVKDGRLLTDLGKLCGEKLEVTCPDAKLQEVLLAIETPAGAAAPGGAKPPAGPKPGPVGAPGPAKPTAPGGKPYDFLSGYVLKEGTIKIGRVSYQDYVVTDLAGSMAMKDNVARVYDFKAKAYKGDVIGKVSADLNVPGIAHSGEIRPTGVDADAAATEIMAYKDIFHGKVSGTITWAGVGFKPGEFEALDGKVQVKYEEGMVRNIEKFPPLREAVGALVSDYLVPTMLKELHASEFKFVPTELNLVLEAVDGKPAIRAKDKTLLRTVEADQLEVGLLGGVCLFPDAKGEFPFLKDTRMYVQRIPNKLLDKVNVEGMLPKEARTESAGKSIREAIQKGAHDGKVYVGFRRTVQNPDVDKSSFAKDLVKEFLKNLGSDILKNPPDILKKPIEDLFKKKPKL